MRTQTTSSESVEMYLKTVAEMGADSRPVPVAAVAGRLGVTAVSASEMLKRLGDQGYISHIPYKGVVLTDEGRSVANSIIRRQRLWECFLVNELHMSWIGAYEAACRLEHATSNVMAEALAGYLGHPDTCPHGNPIPPGGPGPVMLPGEPLSTMQPGSVVRVTGIQPTETDVYAYLKERGILPRADLVVLARAPLDGPLTVRVGDRPVVIGLGVAALIHVTRNGTERAGGEQLTLDQLPAGRSGLICHVGGPSALRRRYMEMGFIRGETIRTERIAPLGDPIAFRVKGYQLSLRRDEACYIRVSLLPVNSVELEA